MTVNEIYTQLASQCDASIEYVIHELRQIRTGQVTPSLVEGIQVNAYGGSSLTLQQMASIMTEGPSTLVVSPFDPATVQEIERAITGTPLQLSVRVDGRTLHVSSPPLSQEQREKFAKLAGEKVEDGKVKIRMHRDEARKHLKLIFDEKEIGEDDKFRAEKEIDIRTKAYTDKLDEIKTRKQDDIMSVS